MQMALWNLIYMRIWVGFATRLPLIACVISEWASQERGGYHGEAGLGEHARPLWLLSVELSLDSSIGATGRAWQWPALQWYVLGQWLLRFQLDSFDRATWRIQWQKKSPAIHSLFMMCSLMHTKSFKMWVNR